MEATTNSEEEEEEAQDYGLKRELFQLLDSLDIAYENVELPVTRTIEALMPHLGPRAGPGAAVTKNIFMRDKKRRLWMLSCRHDRKVNLGELGKLLGAKDLRLGNAGLLRETLGVCQGAVGVYGLMRDREARRIRLAIDEALVDGSYARSFYPPMVNDASAAVSTEGLKKFLKEVGHEDYVTVKF